VNEENSVIVPAILTAAYLLIILPVAVVHIYLCYKRDHVTKSLVAGYILSPILVWGLLELFWQEWFLGVMAIMAWIMSTTIFYFSLTGYEKVTKRRAFGRETFVSESGRISPTGQSDQTKLLLKGRYQITDFWIWLLGIGALVLLVSMAALFVSGVFIVLHRDVFLRVIPVWCYALAMFAGLMLVLSSLKRIHRKDGKSPIEEEQR
jgi:hypothetical protein